MSTAISDKLSIGGAQLVPTDSSTRLLDLATSGGSDVLFAKANGDIVARPLTASDLPSTLLRKDAAAGLQTVNAAVSIANTFSVSGTANLATLTVSGPATLANTLSVTGLAQFTTVNTSGVVTVQGATGLPTSTSALHITGGYSTPVSGRFIYGDGTGWSLRFASRSSSTTTDRFQFSDTGTLEVSKDLLPFTGYSGNIGLPTRKWGSLHGAELFLETIVAQERITTMGGRLTVTPSNVLARDVNATSTVIYVKYPSFLHHVGLVELGSKIRLEANGSYEAMVVLNTATPPQEADGSYGYTVYRGGSGQDGTGGTAQSWPAGTGIIDTGKVGSGMIDAYAVRGLTANTIVGPAIDFLVRTGIQANDLAPRASLGNLDGQYGYSGTTWGAAFGNPSGSHVAIDDTNGVRMRIGSTTYAQLGSSSLTLGVTSGDHVAVNSTALAIKSSGTTHLTANSSGLTASGSIFLSSGGKVTSNGNFTLGASEGLRLERWSSTTMSEPRSITWYNSGSLSASIGQDSTGALRINSRTSGSGTGIRMALAAYAVGSVEPGLMLSKEQTSDTDITNAVLQAAASGVGKHTQIQLVPLHGSLSGTATSLLGLSSNPWDYGYINSLRPGTDATYSIGTSSNRYSNIHLALPAESAPTAVIVNNASTDLTRLAYIVGYTGSQVIGGLTYTWKTGILVSVA